MSIVNLAAEIFLSKIGGSANTDQITSGLTTLLFGDGGDVDLMGLVSKFQTGDLASLAASWLGDGANEALPLEQIKNVLGEANVAQFASSVGIDASTALDGLSQTIPELIDQSSSGGSILDSVGGLGGIANMAKKFF